MIAERNKLAEKTISELLENIEKLKKERREMTEGYSQIKNGMDRLLQLESNEKK